jgi:hypothetical protein
MNNGHAVPQLVTYSGHFTHLLCMSVEMQAAASNPHHRAGHIKRQRGGCRGGRAVRGWRLWAAGTSRSRNGAGRRALALVLVTTGRDVGTTSSTTTSRPPSSVTPPTVRHASWWHPDAAASPVIDVGAGWNTSDGAWDSHEIGTMSVVHVNGTYVRARPQSCAMHPRPDMCAMTCGSLC